MVRIFNTHICLICKCLSRDPICEFCWPPLFDLSQPYYRLEKGFTTKSLFTWRDDRTQALQWLIHSLKGQSEAEVWRTLAQTFVAKLHIDWQAPRSLIAIPGRQEGHAEGFAAALAEVTGGEVLKGVLARPEKKVSQKQLRRQDRLVVEFSNLKPCTKYTNVVIVDDVVTTGATVHAAYVALGRPKHCEVWCLVDRRPCGG